MDEAPGNDAEAERGWIKFFELFESFLRGVITLRWELRIWG